MKTSLILAVIFGLLANCFAFKLGENHDHEHDLQHNNEHEHEHEHDHEHDHSLEHQQDHDHSHEEDHDNEAREGKAEALDSDIQSNFVDPENTGLAVDFSRFNEL